MPEICLPGKASPRFVAQSLQLINHPQEDAMAGKFEVYKDRAGKFRFRLKASHGQVVATGEAYETKTAAKKGCEAVARTAGGPTIRETAS